MMFDVQFLENILLGVLLARLTDLATVQKTYAGMVNFINTTLVNAEARTKLEVILSLLPKYIFIYIYIYACANMFVCIHTYVNICIR